MKGWLFGINVLHLQSRLHHKLKFSTMNSPPNYADYIRFYSPYLPTIDLYHGKMGCLLAMHLYGLQVKSHLYLESADWLLEDVLDHIDERLPLGMEHGLIGLAFGVSLLQRYGEMEVDLNEVLAEIDERIMQFDPRRIKDVSFRSGLLGVMAYLQLRKQCGVVTSIDTQYIHEINDRCQQLNTELSKDSWTILLTDLFPPTFLPSNHENKAITLDGGSSYFILKSYDALLPRQ